MILKKRKAKRTSQIDGYCGMALPDNFHSADLLADLDKGEKEKLRLKDQFFYILNTIISLSVQKRYDDRDFYPVDSQILNEVCGKSYTEAISLLIKHEVIDSDDSYIVGEKVKGYRLIGEYAGAGIKYRELNDRTMREKFLFRKREKEEGNDKALMTIPYIVKWFDKDRLKIDEEKCHQFIEFYGNTMRQKFKQSETNNYKDRFVNNRITQKMNNAITSVSNFAIGEFKLTRAGKDNRLHNPVAGIKKELRSFISFDGQPLIGVDITASQPYLFTTLLDPRFYKNDHESVTLKSVYPELNSLIQDTGRLGNLKDIIIYGNNKKLPGNELVNIFGFEKNDWTKDFYTFLMDEVERVNPSDKKRFFPNRLATKMKMMLILYDKKGGKRDYFKAFEQIFPVEGRLIAFFNSIEGDNYLPILLQRIESALVLDEICNNIAIQYPDVPLLPAHDCIYTISKFVEIVEREMIATLTKITGHIPGLKVENNNDQEILQNLKYTAHEELSDILKKYKKPKSNTQPIEKFIGLKKPLISTIPNLNNESIISTRYIDIDKVDLFQQDQYSNLR